MNKKSDRPPLRVVKNDMFVDDGGRDPLADSTAARSRRRPEIKLFARIPYDLALKLWRRRVGGAAWMLLIEVDRLILSHRGQNPVRLYSPRLRAAGLTYSARARALRQLEAAGAIKVERRGKGIGPLVWHLGYPRQG
jgi:hypothetical protein